MHSFPQSITSIFFPFKIYESDPELSLGDVTTVNLTQMSGGVQSNVVPNEFTLGFDCRVTLTEDLVEFEAKIRRWMEEVWPSQTSAVSQNASYRFKSGWWWH